MATMKMVRSAATEERTGEVREMRMRNDPEKARSCQLGFKGRIGEGHILALARTLMAIIQACSPLGKPNSSQPI